MKVKELIEQLKNYNGELEICIENPNKDIFDDDGLVIVTTTSGLIASNGKKEEVLAVILSTDKGE